MAKVDSANNAPNVGTRITKHLRVTLIKGLLILLPMIATYVIIKWLFTSIDGLLQPIIQESLGVHLPGLGAIALILIIYFFGLAEENFLGRRIVNTGRGMLMRIPIINAIYAPARQLIDAFSGTGDSGFRQVVMIEYPRKDAWTIGFLTANTTGVDGSPLSIIYIPTAPTPNSGWIALLPDKDVLYTNLSVASAMHLVLSGGIIAPPMIANDPALESQ